jgi:hypothetical protein
MPFPVFYQKIFSFVVDLTDKIYQIGHTGLELVEIFCWGLSPTCHLILATWGRFCPVCLALCVMVAYVGL